VPRLWEVYPGICLTTEEKARKNLSGGSRRMPVGKDNKEQSVLVNKNNRSRIFKNFAHTQPSVRYPNFVTEQNSTKLTIQPKVDFFFPRLHTQNSPLITSPYLLDVRARQLCSQPTFPRRTSEQCPGIFGALIFSFPPISRVSTTPFFSS